MSEERRDEIRPHPDFRVGEWTVAPRGNRLVGPEGPVRLEPKVMSVLECLAESPGRTVTKETFMERVWAGTVVSDDVLARCISELRKVFGDNPRRPDYIETVRKSGYRLIAPVAEPEVAAAPAPPERTEESGPSEADEAPEPAEAEADGFEAEQPVDPERAVSEALVLSESDTVPVCAAEPSSVATVPASSATARPVQPHVRTKRRGIHWAIAAGVIGTVALVLGGVFWGSRDEGPLKSVPFTSFPGQEAEPALSPLGDQVAFTWEGPDGGNVDIYVKQEGAETPLRLTSDPARERSPAWSPDGRQVAFIRVGAATEREVVIVPAIGGSEQRVAAFEDQEVSELVWSPDGETLAISAQAAPNGPFSIFLLSVETLQMRQLTEPPASHAGDGDPAFSPSGETLAFVRSASEGADDLFVVPARGGEPEQLTRDARAIAGIDWTPDGQSIVFASNREPAGLWRIPASGGEPEWIATAGDGESVSEPSVARRGGRLTYEQRSSDANIWAMRAGRFGRVPLVHSTRWESNPQFAPDGERIAFASDRSGSPEVWVSAADGTNPLQLTDFGGALVATPRWSPDGGRIAFEARTDEGADIYITDANGGQPRRLTTAPADDLAPSWSRDSTTVYFSSNRTGGWEVWKIPSDGGSASQVTYRGGYNAFESPDGRFLYYAKRGEPGLWRYGLQNGEDETLVLGALEPFDWGNWALTDRGIYFIRRAVTGPTIRFYSFDTGLSSPVATLDEVPEQPSLAVSPDGRTLLYTHVDRNESDILLVEGFQ